MATARASSSSGPRRPRCSAGSLDVLGSIRWLSSLSLVLLSASSGAPGASERECLAKGWDGTCAGEMEGAEIGEILSGAGGD